jgi:hypothetical protein
MKWKAAAAGVDPRLFIFSLCFAAALRHILFVLCEYLTTNHGLLISFDFSRKISVVAMQFGVKTPLPSFPPGLTFLSTAIFLVVPPVQPSQLFSNQKLDPSPLICRSNFRKNEM